MKTVDLPQNVIRQISVVNGQYPVVETVVVFCSRVWGNTKTGSSMDIAVFCIGITGNCVSIILESWYTIFAHVKSRR